MINSNFPLLPLLPAAWDVPFFRETLNAKLTISYYNRHSSVPAYLNEQGWIAGAVQRTKYAAISLQRSWEFASSALLYVIRYFPVPLISLLLWIYLNAKSLNLMFKFKFWQRSEGVYYYKHTLSTSSSSSSAPLIWQLNLKRYTEKNSYHFPCVCGVMWMVVETSPQLQLLPIRNRPLHSIKRNPALNSVICI